jgi:hypothetical protein
MHQTRQLIVLALSASVLALTGCAGMGLRHAGGGMAAASPMGGMQGMHAMHEQIMNAKTPEERQALMAQHMKDMPGHCAEMMGPGGTAPVR